VITKSGGSAASSAPAVRNTGTPANSLAERLTTPVTRKCSGAIRANRQKNAERQPVPMTPNVVAIRR
jgi:hypothetical protein